MKGSSIEIEDMSVCQTENSGSIEANTPNNDQ